ncbi:MAG TPA: porphobilinogen synthase [Coriobacteriia bacterium]|nr:porphobilinogen synthase [Coriobacteriia bacterium]
MPVPTYRPRRLRKNATIRNLVKETYLSVDDLIYPLFIIEGTGIREEISSMPGVFRVSPDKLSAEIDELKELGINSVILFGIPAVKDSVGSAGYDDDGIVQQAIRVIKAHTPDLYVITDVCLCEYTDHGHCGIVLADGTVDNDSTLELLAREAVSHAKAGADMVAPSDMMDGRVAAIRYALDEAGFQTIPIMAYSAKYSSAYYGPFRDAADSAPSFGDRKTYQMDIANSEEALREVATDIDEGADIVMVKPGLAYLDVVRRVKDNFSYPVCVYNVSGEYSMVKAAALAGWVDEERLMMETMIAFKRAGADMIITYPAKDVARWI